LDNRVIKTVYKDPLPIPSYAAAVILAEEWDSQIELVNLKAMHFNNFMSRVVRA
jgi:chaperone required for assembly of F1-ATPase